MDYVVDFVSKSGLALQSITHDKVESLTAQEILDPFLAAEAVGFFVNDDLSREIRSHVEKHLKRLDKETYDENELKKLMDEHDQLTHRLKKEVLTERDPLFDSIKKWIEGQ